MAVTQRLHGWTRPDASTLAGQRAVAGLRVVLGLLWLYNVEWKVPPDFGRSRDADLYRYVTDAVEHPVFPPYSWLVEHLVMPNFTAFGWTVLLVESLLAACLLTGTLTRLAGAVGVLRSGEFRVGLGVYNLLGALVLLVLAALALAASSGRRAAGLAGAALALIAVVSVWARWGRGDVLIGGNGTTAAAYLAVGVALAALCWPRAAAR